MQDSSAERSTAYFFDSFVATFQLGVRREVHQHGAYQLTVSLDGKEHEAGPAMDAMEPALIHFVGTLEAHAFDGLGGMQLLVWLAPESAVGHALAQRYLGGDSWAALPAAAATALPIAELGRAERERWSGQKLRPLMDEFFEVLLQSTPRPPTPIHPAVRKAARIIRSLPVKSIAAGELADRVGLSESRLLHLLKEHLGLPLRPYLQWLRCIDGIVFMTRGQNATQAAIAAGFTDGAHFNRVMRRLISLSPSVLAEHAEIEVCLGDDND